MRLFIVGYMGSGKSRFGSELADLLGHVYYDMDVLFEEKYHITINDFFDKYGEDVFRQLEQKILIETFALTDAVISTGGGTPCFFDNMDVMLQKGTCIYLKQEPETVVQRLKNMRKKRPLLRDLEEKDLDPFIRKHMEERESCYGRAQIILEGEEIDPEVLSKRLKTL